MKEAALAPPPPAQGREEREDSRVASMSIQEALDLLRESVTEDQRDQAARALASHAAELHNRESFATAGGIVPLARATAGRGHDGGAEGAGRARSGPSRSQRG